MSEKKQERMDEERRRAFLRKLRELLRKLRGANEEKDEKAE